MVTDWVLNATEVAAYMVASIVLMTTGGWWSTRLYYLSIRKGYRPSVAGTVIGGCILGVWLATGIAAALIDDTGWSNAAKNSMVFVSIFVAPLVAVTLAVAVLPRRDARRAGARSAPFLFSAPARWLERGLWWTGGASGVAAVGMFWWSPSTAARLINLCLSLVAVPAIFAYYRKRAAAPALDETLSADPRAPVLYLRAFHQELSPFTWGPKEEMACYTDKPITEQTWYTISVTFEQYLGRRFAQELGPFIALGNPEDTLPPEGAARQYVGDDDWKQHFLGLAETAAAIVMEVSRSENLRWEITAIREKNWQRKLFVITPPVPQSNRTAYRWIHAAIRAAKHIPTSSWHEFAAELRDVGFRIDLTLPGPGSVISFDPQAHTVVLIHNAATPDEFVAAVQRHLQALP